MAEVTIDMTGIVVSAGHAAYMPNPVVGVEVDWVWSSSDFEPNYDPMGFPFEEQAEQAARAALVEQGVDPDSVDFDATWEHIVRFRGPRDKILSALDTLIRTIDTVPSDDDDTFDYWPSGARMAFAMDDALNAGQTGRIAEIARRVIVHHKAHSAEELLAKVGL